MRLYTRTVSNLARSVIQIHGQTQRSFAALLSFVKRSLQLFGASRRRGRLLCSFVPNLGVLAP